VGTHVGPDLAQSALARRNSGSGISSGLLNSCQLSISLVDRVARLHGGSARLVRTGPEGSVFRLELAAR
jgi:hypothetical protein